MGRRGRPVHTPTEQTRTLVRRLSGFAVAQDDIAQFVEISDVTLRKYYSADLQRGGAEANPKVAQSLLQLQRGRTTPTLLRDVWLKNRAGGRTWHRYDTGRQRRRLTIEFVEPRPVAAAPGMTPMEPSSGSPVLVARDTGAARRRAMMLPNSRSTSPTR